MTMTPARAPGSSPAELWHGLQTMPATHGEGGKEALPWWSFSPLFGGLVSVWLLAPTLGARWSCPPRGGRGGGRRPESHHVDLGRQPCSLSPGRRCRRRAGLVPDPPVNWGLAKVFGGFNWIFERATHAYGKTVGCASVSARSCSWSTSA